MNLQQVKCIRGANEADFEVNQRLFDADYNLVRPSVLRNVSIGVLQQFFVHRKGVIEHHGSLYSTRY